MRFRFCGDLDCPDWLLAEISILARMSSVKTKLLCAQVVAELIGGKIDYAKVSKLTADAKFEIPDIKAAISALSFVFASSARHGVDGETLSNELQQLGLPKEHSSSIWKTYDDLFEKLRDAFKRQSMRMSRLKSVDWRVDYMLSSSLVEEVAEPEVQLKFVKQDGIKDNLEQQFAFSVSGESFRSLLSELKQAYSLINSIS